VLAVFGSDKSAAAVKRPVGKGFAFYAAFLPGLSYYDPGDLAWFAHVHSTGCELFSSAVARIEFAESTKMAGNPLMHDNVFARLQPSRGGRSTVVGEPRHCTMSIVYSPGSVYMY
jgi:hypothetical protein